MMVQVKVNIVKTGTKDPYEMILDRAVDSFEIEKTIDRLDKLPDDVARFVSESIDLLQITLDEVKQEKDAAQPGDVNDV